MEHLPNRARARRGVRYLGIAAFAAGAGLLFALVLRAGVAPVTSALATLGAAGLLAVGAAHLPVIALLGTAWRAIGAGRDLPGLASFAWARALRDAAAEALPFSQLGGYLMGARALSLLGQEEGAALSLTLLDFMTEFAAKIPYMLAGLAVLEIVHPGPAPAAALAACLAFCALPAIPRLRRSAWRAIRRMFGGRFALTADAAGLRRSFALHLLCWLAGAAECWLIFRLMDVPVTIAAALVIDSLVGAIRAASFFVPAAIGVQEGGYVLLCGLFGISPAAALAFSFARRARDIAIAVPFLASWQWREAQGIRQG
jgi:hypothetical protein